MENLNERHYQAQLKRGTITDKTKLKHFFAKLNEETTEMILEAQAYKLGYDNQFGMEAMDCFPAAL